MPFLGFFANKIFYVYICSPTFGSSILLFLSFFLFFPQCLNKLFTGILYTEPEIMN